MKERKISAFDLDHTLFKANCSFRFGVYLYRQGYFSFSKMLYLASCYFFHKIGLISLLKLHQKNFKVLFYKHPFNLISQYVENFLDREFEYLLYPPAIDKLEKARKQGHFTIILSSSPDFLVKQIAKRFQVDDWEASCYALNSDKCFEKITKIIEGEQKANYLANIKSALKISHENIAAYSDSILDLQFLQSAGSPVAVNPDKRLRRIALDNNWGII